MLYAKKNISVVLMSVLVLSVAAVASEHVRIATYNIKFLSEEVKEQGDRLDKLHQAIELLDADVMGLEEIADRAALQLVFPPNDWALVIDDDSKDDQDVAVAVRKPFKVANVDPDLDADDPQFLFPNKADDRFFPNRRDVLCVEVQLPKEKATFYVLVHHAKSRYGGRAKTDPQRVSASRKIVEALKRDFDEKPFVLLGDFNDNPDDQSLNILETGDPDAAAGPEEIDGPFLINLAEPLCAAGHVSQGRNQSDIRPDDKDRINTKDPGSRNRNNEKRGTDDETGDILFDQLLIPGWMKSRYVSGSAKVFDRAIAVKGNNTTRASDHLPVFADFVFGDDEPDGTSATGVRIVSLLPNPVGEDRGREQVTIGNFTQTEINLKGWKLRNDRGKQHALKGIVPPGGRLTIMMSEHTMPLSNLGGEVELYDPEGVRKHYVKYSAVEAKSGATITFP